MRATLPHPPQKTFFLSKQTPRVSLWKEISTCVRENRDLTQRTYKQSLREISHNPPRQLSYDDVEGGEVKGDFKKRLVEAWLSRKAPKEVEQFSSSKTKEQQNFKKMNSYRQNWTKHT